ncbi:MAG TPA: hypothetical protein VEC19_18345 [Usitatibacter sp.]|nr:hypothetical protein [Usitatibacter sp.]
MNARFVVSALAIFALSTLFGFMVHGGILAPMYTELANRGIYRTPAAAGPLMPYMMAANLVFAVAFTWIYRNGRSEGAWLGQGFRFGLAIALLVTVSRYLIYYVVTPLGSDLVAQQIVYEGLTMIVMGVVAAFINRDAPLAR